VTPMPLTALTFDFWNTLYAADEGAMTLVRPVRMSALRRLLALGGARPSEDEMQEAYRSGFEAYMGAWGNGRHFGAHEQAQYFLDHFAVDGALLPAGSIIQAATEIEDASLLADLQLLPGARETVPALAAAGYRLGIISDTSLSPGRVLRHFLERDGLLSCFTVLTWSDETGYPKPDARMFTKTLEGLGADPTRAAHIGDTPRTDIAGAKAMGMTAIRYAAASDQEEPPEADYVIRDHRELPELLERLGT
jgi:HAD superfamily hydrolase (TIGR01509 family)